MSGPRKIDKYLVHEAIGQGGMGAVYRAYDPDLRREVALKVVLGGEWSSSESRARFEIEAEAAARLRHPGIVSIHAVNARGESPFLVMDLIEGEPLDEVIARRAPLPPRDAAELIRGVAEALDHAHSRGVVHRDVKPQNILVTAEGRPVLTDFGLAKRTLKETGIESLSRAGQILGTLAYMSPEQRRGEAVDGRSDLFPLGVTLYELLSSEHPFYADRDDLTKDRLPPRLGVDRDLESVCLACLEEDPQARYQSGADLAADLGRFLRNEPVQARPPSAWRRFGKWTKRNPLLVRGLSFSAALLLIVIGVASWWTARAERERALAEVAASEDRAQRSAAEARASAEETLREDLEAAMSLIAAAQDHASRRQSEQVKVKLAAALARTQPTRFVYWYAARACMEGELWEEARELLEKAAERAGETPPYRELYALHVVALRSSGQRRSLFTDPLRRLMALAAERGEENEFSWFARGVEAQREEDLPRAIRCYDQALESNPTIVYALNNRAAARAAREEYVRAIEDYTSAIALDPFDALTFSNRANAHKKRGDLSSAVRDYSRSIELAPNEAGGYLSRADVYGRLREFDLARKDFMRASELQPERADIWANVSTCELQLRNYPAALAAADQALKLEPTNLAALVSRASAAESLGQLSLALDSWRAALEQAPKDPRAPAIRRQIRLLEARLARRR